MTLKLPILGVISLVLSSAACSSPSGQSEGGMDGAGSLAPGLRLDSRIFSQVVWEEGAVSYVVLNDRDEDVALTFSECTKSKEIAGCTFGRTVATWRLARRSMRKVTGADAQMIASTSALLGVSANGRKLGYLPPELVPFASERPVVSNASINSTGGNQEHFGQVETDFFVAPETAFTLHLALPVQGALTLSSVTKPVEGLPFLDVVGARSNDAEITPIESGFSVAVPDGASTDSPVDVAIDVRHPEGFSGKLVGFDAWFCVDLARSGGCVKGLRLQRAIPVETPLP